MCIYLSSVLLDSCIPSFLRLFIHCFCQEVGISECVLCVCVYIFCSPGFMYSFLYSFIHSLFLPYLWFGCGSDGFFRTATLSLTVRTTYTVGCTLLCSTKNNDHELVEKEWNYFPRRERIHRPTTTTMNSKSSRSSSAVKCWIIYPTIKFGIMTMVQPTPTTIVWNRPK